MFCVWWAECADAGERVDLPGWYVFCCTHEERHLSASRWGSCHHPNINLRYFMVKTHTHTHTIILIKRYSLTRVKLTALYKHLITKTTLTYISYCTMVAVEEMEGMGHGPDKSSVDDIQNPPIPLAYLWLKQQLMTGGMSVSSIDNGGGGRGPGHDGGREILFGFLRFDV